MEVVVPDLGDFADVEIIDVLVKPGDSVKPEQGLVTLETEKATMDVPAPAAGRVGELKVKIGDRVSTGHVIMSLEPDGGRSEPRAETKADSSRAARESSTAAAAQNSMARQPAPTAGNGTPRVVTVPDLGDFAGVEIIDVLVKPGDRVAAEQGLVTLETEKASMDVPAPEAGEILELKVAMGDKVSAGDPLLLLRPTAASGSAPTSGASAAAPQRAAPAQSGVESASAAPVAPKPVPSPRAATPSAVATTVASFSDAHAGPSVRKLARELGVELGRVRGSGHKNRVTVDDVKAFVKEIMQSRGGGGGALPAVPVIDFARYGPVDTQPLTRIQKISGPRLHASWVNIPHVTQHDEADITELEEKREALKEQAQARGIKLTPLAFIVRACVLALTEMPIFKSSLAPDGESLIVKRYTHIGFAADTPNGLLVPVIRDADKKDVYELAEALATLSERARAGRLQADDIQGAVFTVSSLGGIGGRFFSPIINAPEVAILGVSRSQMQPVYRGAMFVPRLMLPLSLSYDHRVIDGAKAVRFTTRLGEILSRPDKLLEATP